MNLLDMLIGKTVELAISKGIIRQLYTSLTWRSSKHALCGKGAIKKELEQSPTRYPSKVTNISLRWSSRKAKGSSSCQKRGIR